MNTGTSVILKEMTRLTGISHEVQENSSKISQAAETINSSIDTISRNSIQNDESVRVLQDLTRKYKL